MDPEDPVITISPSWEACWFRPLGGTYGLIEPEERTFSTFAVSEYSCSSSFPSLVPLGGKTGFTEPSEGVVSIFPSGAFCRCSGEAFDEATT